MLQGVVTPTLSVRPLPTAAGGVIRHSAQYGNSFEYETGGRGQKFLEYGPAGL